MMKVLCLVCLCVLGLSTLSMPEQSRGRFGPRLTERDTDEAEHVTGGARSKRGAAETALKITIQSQIDTSLKQVVDELQRMKVREVQMKNKVVELDRQVTSLKEDRQICRDRLAKLERQGEKVQKRLDTQDEKIGKLEARNNDTQQQLVNINDSLVYMAAAVDGLNQSQSELTVNVSKCVHLDALNVTLGCLCEDADNVNHTLVNLTRVGSIDAGKVGALEKRPNSSYVPQNNTENQLRNVSDFPEKSPSMKSETGDWFPVTRLLIAERESSTPTLHQLDIGSNQLTVFPQLNATYINSLIYDPSRNNIIFSTYSAPPGIYSSPLDGGSVVTVRKNTWSRGMAVDPQRDLLFLSTRHPSNTVSRMTPGGENFTILAYITGYPHGVAVDTRRQVVYVCTWSKLLSVSYSGGDVQTVARRSSGWGIIDVTVDMERDLLYYSDRNTIRTRPLSGGDVDQVGQVAGRIWNLIYHNNKLYTSPWSSNSYIHVLHYNGSLIDRVSVKKESAMCLIP